MTFFPGLLRYAGLFLLLWGVSARAEDRLTAVSAADLARQAAAAGPLTLEQAVSLARIHDPWLRGSRYREQAMQAESVAVGALPDPVLSLGVANLPVDSFAFGRESMTQFGISVSQMFPRGQTRALWRRQLRERSTEQPPIRRDRLARVAATVSKLWLEAYRNRETIRLIENDRALFEQLVDLVESGYASAGGNTRQQDLLRAQLELTRLADRLTVLRQQRETALARLSEWLPGMAPQDIRLADHLPVPDSARAFLPVADPSTRLADRLALHPRIAALDRKIAAATTGVELAKQKYRPQWNLHAAYGYRRDDPAGNERSDFFSLGLSFDMPLFRANRQDREVQAARARQAAVNSERTLALRAMRASTLALTVRLERLNQRKALYEGRLLQEIHDQAEAALTAYTHDAGDFAEAVRARIAELNANIDFLHIDIDRRLTMTELNYFLRPPREDSARELTP